MCLTIDTWSGEIVDVREVIFRSGASTTVSRRRGTGVHVDLSSDAPIAVTGKGGISLGIGSAASHLFPPV